MGSSQLKLEERTTMNLLIAITLAVLGIAAAEPRYGYYGHGYGYPAYGYYGHHYGKRSADAEPGYGYYGHGYGYPYRYGHHYGKRSADAEPAAVADADAEPAAVADADADAEPGYGYPAWAMDTLL